MKLAVYSDLHLEFKNPFKIPKNLDADVLILAGDIIVFNDDGFGMLKEFLEEWKKPVLFVAGNHEFYTKKCSIECSESFYNFSSKYINNLVWLKDTSIDIDGVSFFGGTMWTDFNNSDPIAIMNAKRIMNDFNYIKRNETFKLRPEDTVNYHTSFKKKLLKWFKTNKCSKKVVISHHAPCLNPQSKYKGSVLEPAFNSLDMIDIIKKIRTKHMVLWAYSRV